MYKKTFVQLALPILLLAAGSTFAQAPASQPQTTANNLLSCPITIKHSIAGSFQPSAVCITKTKICHKVDWNRLTQTGTAAANCPTDQDFSIFVIWNNNINYMLLGSDDSQQLPKRFNIHESTSFKCTIDSAQGVMNCVKTPKDKDAKTEVTSTSS